jgi:hypothetical protein
LEKMAHDAGKKLTPPASKKPAAKKVARKVAKPAAKKVVRKPARKSSTS